MKYHYARLHVSHIVSLPPKEPIIHEFWYYEEFGGGGLYQYLYVHALPNSNVPSITPHQRPIIRSFGTTRGLEGLWQYLYVHTRLIVMFLVSPIPKTHYTGALLLQGVGGPLTIPIRTYLA